MTRIHLVYPHADRISCPDAIGRNLALRLRSRYEVRQYDWDSAGVIEPEEGDVLLGHPHPTPWTIFRRSLRREGWKRRLVLAPYNHGDLRQSAWLDPVIDGCDLFLALTGEHWYSTAPASVFAHWVPKMIQMDLAVDRADFPEIKQEFNPPGRRSFLFIGHSRWTKNIGYLSDIATKVAGSISWIGTGEPIRGVTHLGFHDFREASSLDLVARHDFLLSVGRADANPVSVLEAMAWGLIPVCSEESSHASLPGIVRIRSDDAGEASRMLESLQGMEAERLHEMQRDNWRQLDDRFTWDRFTQRVMDTIETDRSPNLGHPTMTTRLRIGVARASSPYGWWRPGRLWSRFRDVVRGRLRRG